jgi:U3 small nucleolar RNA-associated protein 18
MTAGFDKKVHLFNIDEKKNQKVASYFIKDLPIFSASFSPDGNEIFVTGRRNYFYTIDLAKGTTDRIHSIQGILL